MIPAEFEYAGPPTSVRPSGSSAITPGEAKVLSGGYSLLPLLKLRLAPPALLVDIQRRGGARRDRRAGRRAAHRRPRDPRAIRGRRGHRRALPGRPRGGRRHRRPPGPQLGHDRRLLRPCRPVLRLAGGAHRDPRLAHVPQREGRAHDRRPRLLRRLVPDRHRADELLVEIRIPTPAAGTASAYKKLERRAGDFATVGVAVQLHLGADGRIDRPGSA